MKRAVIALLFAAVTLAAQSGQFQQGQVSGIYGIVTPPNFGGLQGPTNIFVCAKTADALPVQFMATLVYEADGPHEVTFRLKGSSALGACAIGLTPGLKRVVSLSVLPYDPSKELTMDVK